MKVLITIPSVNSVNGGIYILIKWANKLKEIYGHDVTVFSETKNETRCKWRHLDAPIVHEFKGGYYDIVIIGSPHSIWMEDLITTEKCFLFCQMLEHMFKPYERKWYAKCEKFYLSRFPMFSISKWNIEFMETLGRIAPTYYIGNGMDFNDFPIDVKPKDKFVLIESPESTNPSKDPEMIGLRVAQEIKRLGYKVIAYGSRQLSRNGKGIVNQYFQSPDLKKINHLYSISRVLIKATQFDARSCSPMEAMTKSCVTSRAIIEGDDDLIHGENSLRCGYDFYDLKEQTLELLNNAELLSKLSANCVNYVREQTWENHLEPVNKIITQ